MTDDTSYDYTDASSDPVAEADAYDTNNDGVIDSVTIDTDGDGVPDIQVNDTNFDGTADQVLYDTDGDGWANYEADDTNQDGVIDQVSGDTNEDGTADWTAYTGTSDDTTTDPNTLAGDYDASTVDPGFTYSGTDSADSASDYGASSFGGVSSDTQAILDSTEQATANAGVLYDSGVNPGSVSPDELASAEQYANNQGEWAAQEAPLVTGDEMWNNAESQYESTVATWNAEEDASSALASSDQSIYAAQDEVSGAETELDA